MILDSFIYQYVNTTPPIANPDVDTSQAKVFSKIISFAGTTKLF